MNTPNFASLIVIIAEIALALHPILIKQIDVNLPTQLLARLGTYTLLGTAFSNKLERQLAWGSLNTTLKSLLFGLMNLIHIGSSYISYQNLPAGSALALFYTYPFFNILAGLFFLGDKIDIYTIPLMIFAFLGVLLISKFTNEETKNTNEEKQNITKKNTVLGVLASLISAITETMIFLIVKTGEEPSPWLAILRLYPGALLLLLGYFGFFSKTQPFNFELRNWIPLLVFNIFIGFLGYSLRFFSIPRLSTAVFSLLTFIGVVAGYIWGLLFAKEVPSIGALTGAGLITGSLAFLRQSYS